MEILQIIHYKKRFFSKDWIRNSYRSNLKEIENIKERVDYLMNDQIIFSDALDMEACNIPYSISKYKWNDYPEDDVEWTYMLNRQGFMVDLAITYALTQKSIYLKKWKQLLSLFIKENGVPNASNNNSWRPIDSGIRLMNWLKSLTYLPIEKLTNEELELIDESMMIHIQFIKNSYIDKYRLSNWGVLALSGIAVYDLFFPEKIKSSLMDWVWVQLENQIDLQFYSDGVHWEQSPLYHHEVISSLAYILQVSECLKRTLPINLRAKLEQPMKSSYYMASSDDYLSPLHDSDYVDFTYIYNIYREMGFFPQNGSSSSALFLGALYTDYKRSQIELPTLFHGEKSGFSALKKENVYFTLFNGLHGSSHGHASAGSFTLNYQNEEIISDGGRYTYTESSIRKELKGIAAHNTFFDEEDLSTVITESWGYDHLPLPIFQNTSEIEGISGGYLFSNAWISHPSESHLLSYYSRDFLILEEQSLVIIYDSYRGNGTTLTTTYNFNEICQVIPRDENRIEFKAQLSTGELFVRNGLLKIENQKRSSIYNELIQHQRVINKNKVENGQVNEISVITLNQSIQCQPLSVYQNGKTDKYPDASGVRILLDNHEFLDIYFLFNDVIKGDKLFKTEANQYFYGKITAFNKDNQMIKIK